MDEDDDIVNPQNGSNEGESDSYNDDDYTEPPRVSLGEVVEVEVNSAQSHEFPNKMFGWASKHSVIFWKFSDDNQVLIASPSFDLIRDADIEIS